MMIRFDYKKNLLLLLLLLNILVPFANAETTATNTLNELDTRHEDLMLQFRQDERQYEQHLQALWQARLDKSPTVLLALNKLSDKTGKDKKKAGLWKQSFLQNILQVGGIGATALSGSIAPMIGSSVISNSTRPSAIQQKLDAVSNADLVVLIKQVEDEQANILKQYLLLRQALESKQLIASELQWIQSQANSLPQDNPQEVGQYFAYSELYTQKLINAESSIKAARVELAMNTNADVVRLVEEDILKQLAEKESE